MQASLGWGEAPLVIYFQALTRMTRTLRGRASRSATFSRPPHRRGRGESPSCQDAGVEIRTGRIETVEDEAVGRTRGLARRGEFVLDGDLVRVLCPWLDRMECMWSGHEGLGEGLVGH
jgi:hypothetical protein